MADQKGRIAGRGRRSEWEIRVETDEQGKDRVEVYHRGAWFSDADDLEDAIGILNGQRATEVTINDHGYVSWRSL